MTLFFDVLCLLAIDRDFHQVYDTLTICIKNLISRSSYCHILSLSRCSVGIFRRAFTKVYDSTEISTHKLLTTKTYGNNVMCSRSSIVLRDCPYNKLTRFAKKTVLVLASFIMNLCNIFSIYCF